MKILFPVILEEDEHLGLMGISSVLKQHGYSPRVIKAEYDSISREIRGINKEKIVIAYSVTSFSVEYCLKLNRSLKENFDFFSVFGGYYTTGSPDIIDYDGVDAVCIGEGEYAFLDIIQCLDRGEEIKNIMNLWVKEGGRVYKNELRTEIQELDDLPFPDRDLFNRKSLFYQDRIYMMTSRGCIYNCPHCYTSTLRDVFKHKNTYRRRSVDNVIQEVEEIRKKQPVEFIIFHDEIFNLMPEWLEEFSDKYSHKIGMPFRCNIRIELLDRNMVEVLKRANCHTVSYGFETADERILKEILFRQTGLQEMREKAMMLKDVGIKIRTTNMIGLPTGSIDTDILTMKENIRSGTDYSMAAIFRKYPGSIFSKANSENDTDAFSPLADYRDENDLYQPNSLGKIRRMLTSFYYPEYGYRNDSEKKMIANLHELFPIICNVPFLLPFIKIIIKIPARRIFRMIHLLWAFYSNFFILHPTCSPSVLFVRIIKREIKLRVKRRSAGL